MNPTEITWSLQTDSTIILVFGKVKFSWKFRQNHPSKWIKWQRAMEKSR